MNADLLEYYKGLIELRKENVEFRRAKKGQIKFYNNFQNDLSIGYSVKMHGNEFVVLMNANQNLSETFKLPDGDWDILVNANKAGINIIDTVSGDIEIPAISGLVLRKK